MNEPSDTPRTREQLESEITQLHEMLQFANSQLEKKDTALAAAQAQLAAMTKERDGEAARAKAALMGWNAESKRLAEVTRQRDLQPWQFTDFPALWEFFPSEKGKEQNIERLYFFVYEALTERDALRAHLAARDAEIARLRDVISRIVWNQQQDPGERYSYRCAGCGRDQQAIESGQGHHANCIVATALNPQQPPE